MNLNVGYRHPFLIGTHFSGGVGDNPRTLTELAMGQLSYNLRSRPEWWKYFQNQTTRAKWAEQAASRPFDVRVPSANASVELNQQQIEYVLDELGGYAALRDEVNGCQVSCFERIWESDTLFNSTMLSDFKEELRSLRELSKKRKEGYFITALIDPTLHPLVYDRTFVNNPSSKNPRTCPPPQATDIYTLSQKFCCLPTDLSVSPTGEAQLLSYINNLHPRHTKLYDLFAKTVTRFVPLFEHVLTDLHRNNPLPQRIPGPYRYTVWEEPEEPEHSDDEEGWSNYERVMLHWALNRPIKLPDIPRDGYRGELEYRRHIVNLKSKRLQVIFRVSEINLKPGDPTYFSPPYHVEGMRNEHIVACGRFYSCVENIDACEIQFRMAVTYPRGFEPGDSGATLRTWGLRDGDSCHQYVGSIPIRTGLSIVFPNIYQHRHTPFQLVDPKKEGRISVVSFLLVDPDIPRIPSTSNVTPQQKEWIREALDERLDERIPVELIDEIMEQVESVMSEEESLRYSEEMLRERTEFWKRNDNYHFCIPFDIWHGPQ
ncbi:hypothetical protein K435DRAFT_773175 [Dendrothele bispora CBS 962.96]|uniref:Uncharacterized protein n=1 Tax=Dendrothele bispora (strain CBS 962.96) TaxID=1314807 RepID=A0A4S8MTT0_DENBC|nr:hypothetical protein K435DRAFT_773175 [Dendrothele bispora CBS 962.96]